MRNRLPIKTDSMGREIKPPKGFTIRRRNPKIRRNGECPCGSGMKFKECCLKPKVMPSAYSGFTDLLPHPMQTAMQLFIQKWGYTPPQAHLAVFMSENDAAMKDIILRNLKEMEVPEEFVHAVNVCGFMVTNKNKDLLTPEALAIWDDALKAAKESTNVECRIPS